MPLQKLHPRGQSSKNQLSCKGHRLQERRRTLHTISELGVTEATTPEFSSFVAAIQAQPQEPICQLRAMPDVEKAAKRQSLPQPSSSPRHPQAKTTFGAVPAHVTTPHQKRPHRGLDNRGLDIAEEGWNVRRERARAQCERVTAIQEYHRQPLQHTTQDGSCPTIPRRAVHSASRSSLRSYSSHHHLLANSHSTSGFSSSSSNGTIDRRSSVGTIGSQSDAWSHGFDGERAITAVIPLPTTRNSVVRKSKSGCSSPALFLTATPPPMPVASPPLMQRHYSMPAQRLGNGGRTIQTERTRPSSTTRTSSLPTICIDHVGLSQRSRRYSISRPAQHERQSDVQTARLESLAALTALQPASYGHIRASLPTLANQHLDGAPSQQTCRAPLQHRQGSDKHLRPSSQYTLLPPSTHNRDITASRHHTVTQLAVEHRTVPKRESLAQWKDEREEAKSSFDGVRRVDIDDRVRRGNQLESKREDELMKNGKKGSKVGSENERSCCGGVMRMFRGGF